jgi:aldehyde dehydrogenase (NAD+)
VLTGAGDVGSMLAKHSGVDKVAFTGSTSVGYDIMRNSHVHNLKRITLELGGKSALIIMDDADMEEALALGNLGAFANSGQNCCAGSRTFVHEKIYDEYVEKAAA